MDALLLNLNVCFSCSFCLTSVNLEQILTKQTISQTGITSYYYDDESELLLQIICTVG